MPYVTFQRIPNMEAPTDEGIRVAAALAALRECNDAMIQITPDNAADVVSHIRALLFFPKARDDILSGLTEQRAEILSTNRREVLQWVFIRDNDLKVFSYIIARHLQMTFNAFSILFRTPRAKELVQQRFVVQMFDDWRLLDAERTSCAKTVDEMLEIYATQKSPLAISLSGSSDEEIIPLEEMPKDSPEEVHPLVVPASIIGDVVMEERQGEDLGVQPSCAMSTTPALIFRGTSRCSYRQMGRQSPVETRSRAHRHMEEKGRGSTEDEGIIKPPVEDSGPQKPPQKRRRGKKY